MAHSLLTAMVGAALIFGGVIIGAEWEHSVEVKQAMGSVHAFPWRDMYVSAISREALCRK